jgi:hypothetical protein
MAASPFYLGLQLRLGVLAAMLACSQVNQRQAFLVVGLLARLALMTDICNCL